MQQGHSTLQNDTPADIADALETKTCLHVYTLYGTKPEDTEKLQRDLFLNII